LNISSDNARAERIGDSSLREKEEEFGVVGEGFCNGVIIGREKCVKNIICV
jgi:hypothetical protein